MPNISVMSGDENTFGMSKLSSSNRASTMFSSHNAFSRGSVQGSPSTLTSRIPPSAFTAVVGEDQALLLCTEAMPKDLGNETEDEVDMEVQFLVKTLNAIQRKKIPTKKSSEVSRVNKERPKATASAKRKKKSNISSGSDDSSDGSDDDDKRGSKNGKSKKRRENTTEPSKRVAATKSSAATKKFQRKTQAKKRNSRYDDDKELELVKLSQHVCHSWESLRLGTVLGTPAYNEYLREQLLRSDGRGNGPGGICDHNERRVPQFKSEEVLQMVRNLRPPQTAPPPAPTLGGSGMSSVRRRGPARGSISFVSRPRRTSAVSCSSPAPSSLADDGDENDLEVQAINNGHMMVVDDSGSEGDDGEQDENLARISSSLYSDVLKLYESMCWEDADDWSCFRRYANLNMSSKACIDKLRSLERNASFLEHEEQRVLKMSRELGVYQPQEMSEDISLFMGYGRQHYEDLDP